MARTSPPTSNGYSSTSSGIFIDSACGWRNVWTSEETSMTESFETRTRREFLRYCGATALLMTRFAEAWAEEPGSAGAAATERALRALAEDLEGDLLLPADPLFEPARQIGWNVMLPERRPDLIVRAANQADVVRTLAFARDQQRRVAVRGGGHSWCASAVRAGGVMLDLGRFNSLSIDPSAGTALVGPTVRGTEFLRALVPHGLMFPVAYCPTVPLGGFLLNGGNGLNYNRWGSACSHVLAIDLVLADGRELTVSNEVEPDLFWAARGAGPGFFAVATRFHVALRPLPRAVTLSSFDFPLEQAATAYRLADDLSASLARDAMLAVGVKTASPGTPAAGQVVVNVLGIAFADTSDQATTLLAPLNGDPRVQSALTSLVNAPTDLNGVHGAVGAALPGGHRYLADNIWSNQPLATVLEGMAEHYAQAPSPASNLMVPCFHPEFALEGTAHSMWGRNLIYQYALWTDPTTDERNRAWHDGAMAMLDPHGVGRYVGEADLTRSRDSARECYAPAAWERLRALRATYDPDGLFFDYLGMA
ncbi:MAG: FAD-binding oxidoreductase [Gammaproteobacteria bacterium]|nr:FAD-binding oxidoreductase [Gammaproteobacteria bacterium]